MVKFGRRRSFITSAEKYTETCHDSLLVSEGHKYFFLVSVVFLICNIFCHGQDVRFFFDYVLRWACSNDSEQFYVVNGRDW